MVIAEVFWSFRRNNDLRSASSLAFSLAIALIPALFLVTAIAGLAVGSSQTALAKVQEVLKQLLPTYSQDILREVRRTSANLGAISALNIGLLLLTVTPLVSNMREVLAGVFRRRPRRPYMLEKLFDVVLTILFLAGVAAIGAVGVILTVVEKQLDLPFTMGYFGNFVLFAFLVLSVFLLYLAFSDGTRTAHLIAGALSATALWFPMRPLFHLFISFNPGYGFAFGSFKSLFVIIIWLYYSLIVFLLGAEIAAALDRQELAAVRRLMSGRRDVPLSLAGRFLARYTQGERIFAEGDPGGAMFYVLRGSVTLLRDGRLMATVRGGQYFGIVSFLLDAPRIALAVAEEDTELVVITKQNIGTIMQESPEVIQAVLREVAGRLRQRRAGGVAPAERAGGPENGR